MIYNKANNLHYYQVIVPGRLDFPLIYFYETGTDNNISSGSLVYVPLRNKIEIGLVVGDYNGPFRAKIKYKAIHSVIEFPVIKKELQDLLFFMSNYYLSPKGLAFSLILRAIRKIVKVPDIKYYQCDDKIEKKSLTKRQLEIISKLVIGKKYTRQEVINLADTTNTTVVKLLQKGALQKVKEKYLPISSSKLSCREHISLNIEQSKVFNDIKQELLKDCFYIHLIDGVTGSGKTAIYFELLTFLAGQRGGQYLLLLPEISLGEEFVQRAKNYFKQEPVFWHSQLSDKERKKIWLDIALGKSSLVIGARSALFLPFCNLKMIIVDEEHEQTYKQEETIRYHARDMAVYRAYKLGIACILISATPSLESMWNVKQKKYGYSLLPKRYGDSQHVAYNIIDMRQEDLPKKSFISSPLIAQIKLRVERQEQSLLYINRRGYAPILLCRDCGYIFKTPDTDSFLVEHKKTGMLHCHLTDYKIAKPKECPKCSSTNDFYASGPAIERIYQEVRKLFPKQRVACFSSDIRLINDIKQECSLHEFISKVKNNEIDIIVATQIAAKGYHFPDLTLVGVIDADMGLAADDLRSNEIAYQKLEQVTGRAGRGNKKGEAYLQTYDVSHPLIIALREGLINNFINYEMKMREKFSFPPFGKMISFIIQGQDELATNKFAKQFLSKAPHLPQGVKIFGPMEAPIYILRGKYRVRILLLAKCGINLQKFAKEWVSDIKLSTNINIIIDVDPYNFS